MKKPKYRLSPNEVERLVKEEKERLRKLRIVQVREQAKASAAVIRNDVRREKQRLVNKLAAEIEEQLTAEKEEKIRKLKQSYEGTLRAIGDGHREAHLKGDGYSLAEELKRQQDAEEAAQERYTAALEKQRIDDMTKEREQNKHIIARQSALEVERKRAQEIAALPPPPPDISVELEKQTRKSVQMMDMEAFATTHYHIPDYQVVRAGPNEQEMNDAVAEAEDTDLKLKQDLAERKRFRHEQIEKARIRGNEALQKEMLKHDLGDMLQDLSLLQRRDRRRRQKVLGDVPKQVFIPPERCLEERQEKQLEMERQFDQLYMGQLIEPGPMPEPHSLELSEYLTSQDSASVHGSAETIDPIIPLSRINPALRDLTNTAAAAKGSVPASSAVDKPDTVLKQLLNKIKAQRDGPVSASTAATTAGYQPTTKPAKHSGLECRASMTSEHSRADVVSETTEREEDSTAPHTLSPRVRGHAGTLDLDPEAATANDHMIEELMNRIRLIELQKQQLSQQFQSQSGAFQSLVRSMQPPGGSPDSSLNPDTMLKKVHMDDSLGNNLKEDHPSYGEEVLAQARMGLANAGEKARAAGLTQDASLSSPGVDLATAASNLRPVSGILKGQRNLQFELLASNGFLPSPEVCVESNSGGVRDGGEDVRMRRSKMDGGEGSVGLARQEVGSEVGRVGLGGVGDAGMSRQDVIGPLSGTVGARREIYFGESGAGGRKHDLVDARRPDLDGGDSFCMGNVGDFKASKVTDASFSSMASSGLSDKVRQYAASAGERHAKMDGETLQRVQEYQQQLLQKQTDRRQVLAQVREDIEARRRQLYSSKQSFLSEGIAGGEGAAGRVTSLEGLPVDDISHESVDDPKATEPGYGLERGGHLFSSWTRRQLEKAGLGGVATLDSGMISQWEPIKPFVADPRLCPDPNKMWLLSDPAGYKQQSLGMAGHSDTQQQIFSSADSRTGERTSARNESKDKHKRDKKKDKVRKSLSFDEKQGGAQGEEDDDGKASANVSHVSWQDVLNDTATSVTSSHKGGTATTSEEESCSPVLAPRALVRAASDKSLDTSGGASRNKSLDATSSAGDRSSVVTTASSSLNGSALVARAEERRLGFERRQEELKRQLLDIQEQKDSILQRYQAGQEALHRQQALLREKLVQAVASGGGADARGDDGRRHMETRVANTSSGLYQHNPHQQRSQSYESGQSNLKQPTTVAQSTPAITWATALSEGRHSDSSRSSSGNNSFPGQSWATGGFEQAPVLEGSGSFTPSEGRPSLTSADSYLADISYHKLTKDGEQINLLPAAFHSQPQHQDVSAKGDGSGQSATTAAPTTGSLADSGSSRHQTWASLLQSSTSTGFSQQTGTSPVTSESQAVSTSQARLPAALTLTLTEHQPHELSTIMEVDTPTSSSTQGRRPAVSHSSRQALGAGGPVARGGHQGSLEALGSRASNSSQSLSSLVSEGHSQGHPNQAASVSSSEQSLASYKLSEGQTGPSSAAVIDEFPDLPYPFPKPTQGIFDLTASTQQHRAGSGAVDPLLLSTATAAGTGVGARRSITFSEESNTNTQKGKQEEQAHTRSDTDEEEGLLGTKMPYLVGDTPAKGKTGDGGDIVAMQEVAEASSLHVSGHGDYLRSQAEGTIPKSGEPVVAEEMSKPEWLSAESHGALLSAAQFVPEIMQRLRQQSRDVFGDSTRTEGGLESQGDNSRLSVGEGERNVSKDLSEGNRSSLPSMELEEMSYQDTTDGVDE